MSLATNVVRRGSVYYFRVTVPGHLRVLVPRRELWRSLRTSDPVVARRRGTQMQLLTERLWRDLQRAMQLNIERVDRPAVQAMVDHWLKAQLEEDAYRRDGGDGELFAGVVLREKPDGYPDEIVRRITYDEYSSADEDPFEALTADRLSSGEYVLRDVTDRDLFRRDQGKIYRCAADRHARELEDIAEKHVKALFALLGHEVDEFSGKFETATYMMMTAHKDLWEAIQERDSANWRPRLDRDPAGDLVGRLVALPKPVVVAPATPPSNPSIVHSGKTITEAAAVALKAISKREVFGKKRID